MTPSSWVTWSRFINFLFTNLVATARLVPFWSHFLTTENLPLEYNNERKGLTETCTKEMLISSKILGDTNQFEISNKISL